MTHADHTDWYDQHGFDAGRFVTIHMTRQRAMWVEDTIQVVIDPTDPEQLPPGEDPEGFVRDNFEDFLDQAVVQEDRADSGLDRTTDHALVKRNDLVACVDELEPNFTTHEDPA